MLPDNMWRVVASKLDNKSTVRLAGASSNARRSLRSAVDTDAVRRARFLHAYVEAVRAIALVVGASHTREPVTVNGRVRDPRRHPYASKRVHVGSKAHFDITVYLRPVLSNGAYGAHMHLVERNQTTAVAYLTYKVHSKKAGGCVEVVFHTRAASPASRDAKAALVASDIKTALGAKPITVYAWKQ